MLNQIWTIITLIIMSILGGGMSCFIVISLPVILIWKIYRKFHYGMKITD